MLYEAIKDEEQNIIGSLRKNSELNQYVDFTLNIPDVLSGNGKIKLIILGQDPAVKNLKSRSNIKIVLNLDKNGRLKDYIEYICCGLELKLIENIYATNLLKNFFVAPPTTIREIDILKEFSKYWLSLLQKEVDQYPNVPIISLGEPLLSALVQNGQSKKVRDYWGYPKD